MEALSTKKSMRCTLCRKEFSEADVGSSPCCPNCKTHSIPMSLSQDVEVNVNWHELRILCIWAENWAQMCDKKEAEDHSMKNLYGYYNEMLPVVYSIVKCLQEQAPSFSPLTLSGEFQQLKQAFPGTVVSPSISEDGPLPPKVS